MSLLHRLPLGKMKVFNELLQATWRYINAICKFERAHIVFDSYTEKALKEGERKRQSQVEPLEHVSITLDTKSPVHLDRFWASQKNKELLQALGREFLLENAQIQQMNIVLSGSVYSDDRQIHCVELNIDGNEIIRNDLTSNLEEADLRIIPHVYDSLISGTKSVVVLSNDTDVVTLLFYYMPHFTSEGLQELWVKYGTGTHERFIPLHLIAEKLGITFCKVVYKAHVLPGCDMTSKVGSKTNALKVSIWCILGKVVL